LKVSVTKQVKLRTYHQLVSLKMRLTLNCKL
jgi:hypothetical protein